MNTQANNSTTQPVHMAELSRATQEATQQGVNAQVDINHFREYDSALTIPAIEGYRAVKCLYKKNTKTGKAAGVNSFIRIPDHISDSVVQENLPALMPHILGYLQAEEDKLIKAQHVAGATSIDPSKLTLAAVIEALEATGTNNRLNKERINEWFLGAMHDGLTVAFADKMEVSDTPTDAEMQKLEQVTTVYRDKFASLASGKTAYRPEEAEMLQKALEITGADKTMIGERFMMRLEKMKSSTPDDLLLSL